MDGARFDELKARRNQRINDTLERIRHEKKVPHMIGCSIVMGLFKGNFGKVLSAEQIAQGVSDGKWFSTDSGNSGIAETLDILEEYQLLHQHPHGRYAYKDF
jgi:hypothetical protein